ncbi:MAG: Gfo/Idh/MocA family oxidoreductase [Phycisphaerae bacterium]|nr:Gfo/Idh/MocA family oxidoreductase [Phycisphaerae bacterium]
MSNEDTLGMGLIGCGAFGLFCLDTYSKMDGLRPVAVADVRKNVAEDFAREFNLASYTDPNELLARDDVDLVHIATPPSTHHKIALAALKAGKHVLCEKPLAMNAVEAREMLNEAKQADRISPVNFVLRYNEVTHAVKRIIDAGILGNVLSARLTNCAGDSGLHPEHWFWNKKLSGGIFIEHAVHFFDLYHHWLGEGKLICAHAETRPGTTQEDRVGCVVRHENGAIVNHYHGFDQITHMDRTNHHLVCEMGDIWIDGWLPLQLTIDAAVDDEGAERLSDYCATSDIRVVEEYEHEHRQVMGRGEMRYVTKRIRLHYCPEEDKQYVYSKSVRDLMIDQMNFIHDHSHVRTVTETNGYNAVVLAETAAKLAEQR